MVTYSFIIDGVAGSTDFESIVEAISVASADVRAKLADPSYPVVVVSVDDHEGNLYDAETLTRQASPRSRQ